MGRFSFNQEAGKNRGEGDPVRVFQYEIEKREDERCRFQYKLERRRRRVGPVLLAGANTILHGGGSSSMRGSTRLSERRAGSEKDAEARRTRSAIE